MVSSVGEQGYDNLAAVLSPDLGGVSSNESGFRRARPIAMTISKAKTTRCVSPMGRIAADLRHALSFPLVSSRQVIRQC